MAGTAISVAPASGLETGAAGDALTASRVNSFRISAVAHRLAMHLNSTPGNDAVEFFNLCLSLSRGIDYAVANKEVPDKAQMLPSLLKLICGRKVDSLLQASIMVLMISVKNACNNGWFSDNDSNELRMLAKEIGSGFCSVRDFNTEANTYLPTISTIMSRFYPLMKMGEILAFLEVKPGYGAFVTDFHILKDARSSPAEKIRLFVVQTDNIETSSCIINPPQVNFLINGKGVERRTNVFMDSGPQVPTVITHMLKYGTNLLQAVGQFNGNSIILVAYMSDIPTPNYPSIQDYEQPAVSALDTDSDLIEGPSRISLNCPISFRRISIPVKGHSCKHLQCFDFFNYVDINSRRPSWRCPHCNRYVCFTDIRMDQNMFKVLQEVGESVADVIISADGSWKAVMESDDHADQLNKTSNCKQDGNVQKESTGILNVQNILDLTEGDDVMDADDACETDDRKPILDTLQSQSSVENLTMNHSDMGGSENAGAQIEDDFWSGIYLSTYGLGASSASPSASITNSVLESAPSSLMLSPILTDAVSPALNQETEQLLRTALLGTSAPSGQSASPNSLQLQPSQLGNSTISNEFGMFPSITRHVTRTPIAVQALPAPTLASVSQQRPGNSLNTLVHSGASATSQISPGFPLITDGFSSLSNNVERLRHSSRSHTNPLQVSQRTSSSLQQHSSTQIGARPGQSQLPSAYGVSNQPGPLNLRMPHPMGQSPNVIRSSAHLPSQISRTQVQGGSQNGVGQTTGAGSSQHTRMMIATQRAAQMPRPSPSMSVPIPTSRTSSSYPVTVDGLGAPMGEQTGNLGGTAQPVMRAESLTDLPAEQNWRPTGRMRGSLSGQAYSAALSQYLTQPTQPVQAARPALHVPSPLSGLPSQLHALMANSRNSHIPHSSS